MTVITSDVCPAFSHGSHRTLGSTAAKLISSATPVTRGVLVKAASGNNAVVFIGGASVTADSTAATDGYPLAAGEREFFWCDDISKLYGVTSGTNQKVFFWGA
jgi:hypothetical protein